MLHKTPPLYLLSRWHRRRVCRMFFTVNFGVGPTSTLSMSYAPWRIVSIHFKPNAMRFALIPITTDELKIQVSCHLYYPATTIIIRVRKEFCW